MLPFTAHGMHAQVLILITCRRQHREVIRMLQRRRCLASPSKTHVARAPVSQKLARLHQTLHRSRLSRRKTHSPRHQMAVRMISSRRRLPRHQLNQIPLRRDCSRTRSQHIQILTRLQVLQMVWAEYIPLSSRFEGLDCISTHNPQKLIRFHPRRPSPRSTATRLGTPTMPTRTPLPQMMVCYHSPQ